MPIVMGTDAGVLPHGRTPESSWRSRRPGLSPAEALRAATIDAAGLLGATDIGEIRVGAVGDLVVVAGDPLQDIHVMETPVLVVKRPAGTLTEALTRHRLIRIADAARGTTCLPPPPRPYRRHRRRASRARTRSTPTA